MIQILKSREKTVLGVIIYLPDLKFYHICFLCRGCVRMFLKEKVTDTPEGPSLVLHPVDGGCVLTIHISLNCDARVLRQHLVFWACERLPTVVAC